MSLGAKFKNIHTGLIGDAGVFSFYPAKHITTGEGGMLITKNKKIYEKIKLSKSLGINKSFLERKTPGIYDATALGFNYRMSEIHAAIGLQQLKKINLFLSKRKFNFKFLKNKLLKSSKIKILDSQKKHLKNSFYCMNVILNKNLSKKRKTIINFLKDKKIGTSIYYPQPVPRMTYYKKKYGYNKNTYNSAAIISDRCISLPVGPHLKKKDLNYISKIFINLINKLSK